jgi:hypothetical protein
VIPVDGEGLSSPAQATAPRRRYGLSAVAAVALVLLCGLCFASAASMSTTTASLAAARIAVPRCSTAGIQVLETVTGGGSGVVSPVVLNNIDAACAGGTLDLTLNSGGGSTVSASGTVPAGGGSMTLTLSPAPTLVVGGEVDIVVVGP